MYVSADDANAQNGKLSCVLRDREHLESAPPRKRNPVFLSNLRWLLSAGPGP